MANSSTRRRKSSTGNHRSTGSRKSAGSTSQRKQRTKNVTIIGSCILAIVLLVMIYVQFFYKPVEKVDKSVRDISYDIGSPTMQVPMPQLDVQLLTINEYSRPGTVTDKITGVVVHYTANPGSTAQNNRDYFENLKDTKDNKVSSNFVIGIEGEIIQCIPTAEVAYASNGRNHDTVSIECCHPDESGKFTDETYQSLVGLVAYLCGKFDLGTDGIIRHYDVTGKNCPKYFVENEDEWQSFKEDVAKYIAENGE